MHIKFSLKRFCILIAVAISLAAVDYGLYKELSKYKNVIRINISKFKELAKDGNPSAQFAMGNMYRVQAFEWKYFKDYNEGKATNYYQQAAIQGHIKAQYQLAMSYRHGRGVERDKALAMNWLMRAAEQGHTESQYLLGLYNIHRGEHKQARIWLNQAAKNGHAASQEILDNQF